MFVCFPGILSDGAVFVYTGIVFAALGVRQAICIRKVQKEKQKLTENVLV